MADIEQAEKQLAHIQDKIVEGEQAFDVRATELQQAIAGYEKRLHRAKRDFGLYETNMQTVRVADDERAKELDKREERLDARERKLNEDRVAFKEERDRFYQTKDLQ